MLHSFLESNPCDKGSGAEHFGYDEQPESETAGRLVFCGVIVHFLIPFQSVRRHGGALFVRRHQASSSRPPFAPVETPGATIRPLRDWN